MINQKDVKKPANQQRQNQQAEQRQQENLRRGQGFQAQPAQGQNQSQQNKDQKNLANKPGQQPGKEVKRDHDTHSTDKSRPQQPHDKSRV